MGVLGNLVDIGFDIASDKKMLDAFAEIICVALETIETPSPRQIAAKNRAINDLESTERSRIDSIDNIQPIMVNIQDPTNVTGPAGDISTQVTSFSQPNLVKPSAPAKSNPVPVQRGNVDRTVDIGTGFRPSPSSMQSAAIDIPGPNGQIIRSDGGAAAISEGINYLSDKLSESQKLEQSWIQSAVLTNFDTQNQEISKIQNLAADASSGVDAIDENLRKVSEQINKAVAYSAAEASETTKAGDKAILEAINMSQENDKAGKKEIIHMVGDSIKHNLSVMDSMQKNKMELDDMYQDTLNTIAKNAAQFITTMALLIQNVLIPGVQKLISTEFTGILTPLNKIKDWIFGGKGITSMGHAIDLIISGVSGFFLGNGGASLAGKIIGMLPIPGAGLVGGLIDIASPLFGLAGGALSTKLAHGAQDEAGEDGIVGGILSGIGGMVTGGIDKVSKWLGRDKNSGQTEGVSTPSNQNPSAPEATISSTMVAPGLDETIGSGSAIGSGDVSSISQNLAALSNSALLDTDNQNQKIFMNTLDSMGKIENFIKENGDMEVDVNGTTVKIKEANDEQLKEIKKMFMQNLESTQKTLLTVLSVLPPQMTVNNVTDNSGDGNVSSNVG